MGSRQLQNGRKGKKYRLLTDCVYIVSVDYDSITTCTSKFPESSAESFIRSLQRRRKHFLSAGFLRRRKRFSKDRSARRNENHSKIVKIGVIIASFEPFKVLHHFLANSADRPGIYIETLYKTNFPRDVYLNSLKSGG